MNDKVGGGYHSSFIYFFFKYKIKQNAMTLFVLMNDRGSYLSNDVDHI